VAKVVVGRLNVERKGRKARLPSKRVPGDDGRLTTLHVLDADSTTFGEDLRYVFKRSVAKARRENKRITGVTDFVPAKR
jgi:hypothetical protein